MSTLKVPEEKAAKDLGDSSEKMGSKRQLMVSWEVQGKNLSRRAWWSRIAQSRAFGFGVDDCCWHSGEWLQLEWGWGPGFKALAVKWSLGSSKSVEVRGQVGWSEAQAAGQAGEVFCRTGPRLLVPEGQGWAGGALIQLGGGMQL